MKPKESFEEHVLRNLGNYQSIDVEGDWKKVRKRMNQNKSIQIHPFWRAAAVVILLLGVGYLALTNLGTGPDLISVFADGQKKEVVLPDGSNITLNKHSELVYPEKFKRGERTVKLTGEAFFKVVSNPSQAFVVNVEQKAKVRVLGTTFSIRPDQRDESISVQVLEGKVAFSSSINGSHEIILAKDEQATLNEGSIIKDDTVDRNFISWITGELFFYRENIKEVCRQLQEHYEIEIVLENSVPGDLTFTSTMNNQDLESVLDEISLVLGLDYRYENEKVIFTSPE